MQVSSFLGVRNILQANHEMCPLAQTALFLNSKWDLVVVYNLLEKPLRFSELKEKISLGLNKELTASSLTRILRKLETDRIIERMVTKQIGESIEVTYTLTSCGRELAPAIQELKKWGIKNKTLLTDRSQKSREKTTGVTSKSLV